MPLPILTLDYDQSIIDQITQLINSNHFPNLYLYGDTLVLVKESGDNKHSFEPINGNQLLRLIQKHTNSGRNKNANWQPELPKKNLVEIVLADVEKDQWNGVPKIKGIIYTPVLRPDQTFQTTPGYDPTTQLYLAPNFPTRPLPTKLLDSEVKWAKDFIGRKLFGDFPWAGNSDKSNAIALLATHLLKPSYNNFLVPMAWITAPRAASGKTHLAAMHEEVFRGQRISWPHRDEELGKRIDATLISSQAPTVIFDNVDTGKRVDSAALAEVLTAPIHSARELGTSRVMDIPNTKIWMVTGNNLKIGGDIASRICPVEIAPQQINPEDRTGFQLNLNRWTDDLRAEVLYALMVLVQDWVNAGSPEDDSLHLRGFEHWLQVLGGFCKHHGFYGLMQNRKRVVSEVDEEAQEQEALFEAIYNEFKEEKWKASDLRDRAIQGNNVSEGVVRIGSNPLEEAFPKEENDAFFSTVRLGKHLKKIVGMQYGQYRLNAVKDKRTHGNLYSISRHA